MLCKICNKEINFDKLLTHVNRSHINNFKNKKELAYFVINEKYKISKEQLDSIINEYLFTEISTSEVIRKYKFDFRRYIDMFGLAHKTCAISCAYKSVIDARKNKFIEKFGVDNPSKSEMIKNKKKETFTKNYGVDNIWKLRSYRIWWEELMIKTYGSRCISNIHGKSNNWGWNNISNNEKIIRINNLTLSYINWYYSLNDIDKLNYTIKKIKHFTENPKYVSSLEHRIAKILNLNGVKYSAQIILDNRIFDFKLNDLIIEVQGTYWHCDPRNYMSSDIVYRNSKKFFVSEIWEKDLFKNKIVINNGFKILYLWENDMKNLSDEELFNIIKEHM